MVTTRRQSGNLPASSKETLKEASDVDLSEDDVPKRSAKKPPVSKYARKKAADHTQSDDDKPKRSAKKPSPRKKAVAVVAGPASSPPEDESAEDKRPAKRPRLSASSRKKEGAVVSAGGEGKAVPAPPTAKGKGRRTAGKLARLNTIPTDIFLEIASHLHPLDILHMARTTRQWRATLMSRQSKQIWRAARKTLEGLPDCPEDLSEAEYARLLFERDCYTCGTTNVPKGDFALRVRMCNPCARANVFARRRFNTLFPNLEEAVLFLVPYTNTGAFSHGHASSSEFYLKASVEAMAEKMIEQEETSDEQEYNEWFAGRQAEVELIMQHADDVEDWRRDWAALKSETNAALIAARKKSIIERFVALGYEEGDLLFGWGYEPLLQKPQEVTDKIWANIRKKLEPDAIKARDRRLKEAAEKQNALRQRELHPLHFAVSAKMPQSDLPQPTRMDFFYLPSVEPLWKDRGEPIRPEEFPPTDLLVKGMLELVTQMQKDVQMALVRAASEEFPGKAEDDEIAECTKVGYGHYSGSVSRGYRTGSDSTPAAPGESAAQPAPELGEIDVDRPMPQLWKATSVVACSTCTEPMHWTTLLSHLQTHQPAAHYQYPFSTAGMIERSRRWDPAAVKASRLTQRIMRGILQAGGLSEEKATVQDLERLPKMNCARCGERGLTWRAFFRHMAQEYRTDTAAMRKGPTNAVKHRIPAEGPLDFVTPFVPAVAAPKSNMPQNRDKNLRCKLCGDNRLFIREGVVQHLKAKHGQSLPAAENYIVYP